MKKALQMQSHTLTIMPRSYLDLHAKTFYSYSKDIIAHDMHANRVAP